MKEGCTLKSIHILSARHRRVLRECLEEAVDDEEVTGLLLTGSWARGDAYPESDLDLCFLLRPGSRRPFHAESRQGVWVETHFFDYAKAVGQLSERPTTVYRFLDGVICYDENGDLERLVAEAKRVMADFRSPEATLEEIAYWLESLERKLTAARKADDWTKCSFLVQTNTWKILEALWAVNHQPMPPSGAVLAYFGQLDEPGQQMAEWRGALFAGGMQEKVDAMLTMIAWLLPRLRRG